MVRNGMNVIFISHSIFQKKGGKNETFTWNMHIHANDLRAAFHHGITPKLNSYVGGQHLFDHWVCKSGDQLIFSR